MTHVPIPPDTGIWEAVSPPETLSFMIAGFVVLVPGRPRQRLWCCIRRPKCPFRPQSSAAVGTP